MAKAETAIKTRESVATRQERCGKIIRGLKKLYPDAECALIHDSALQLLVATILSAQSTDETVNKVTPVLFGKYPTAADIAGADPADIEEIIHSTGFFRQKTKSIQKACAAIVENHDGEVPGTMAELVELAGVARKTANVVLGYVVRQERRRRRGHAHWSVGHPVGSDVAEQGHQRRRENREGPDGSGASETVDEFRAHADLAWPEGLLGPETEV